ncbi:hypothetical protein D6D12_00408 [Aureobasidium pullulans]|uniref:Integrase zinc-binding domain-containing protein n=1 Tax=Aureobasidium pullulans TaxID=5580 RepID=A0AB74K644_AURPU|nr:hypothetical protein D6D11_09940 [Aureobasidium pullulans]THX34996.1 hypothetical protein D6D12_00408 [Aureobasidium pullulans]
MPPYPGDPPEWRTFSGSYLDWQPSDEDSSTVTTLTTENERLRAELAGVREELAAARGRADRRDSDRLTHYEWLGRYLALPRRQHRGIMRWVVEHVWRVLAGAKQKFDDTLINRIRGETRSHLFKPHTINIAAADKKKRSRPVTPRWRQVLPHAQKTCNKCGAMQK